MNACIWKQSTTWRGYLSSLNFWSPISCSSCNTHFGRVYAVYVPSLGNTGLQIMNGASGCHCWTIKTCTENAQQIYSAFILQDTTSHTVSWFSTKETSCSYMCHMKDMINERRALEQLHQIWGILVGKTRLFVKSLGLPVLLRYCFAVFKKNISKISLYPSHQKCIVLLCLIQ